MLRLTSLFALFIFATSAAAQNAPRVSVDGVIPAAGPLTPGSTVGASMPGQLDPQLMPLARMLSMLSPLRAAEIVGLTVGTAVVVEHLNHDNDGDYDGSDRKSFSRSSPPRPHGAMRRPSFTHRLFNHSR
jgi:hypothetical protein